MLILKFGGSSVENENTINQVMDIVTKKLEEDHVAVVVSAFRYVTDSLHQMAMLAEKGDESFKDKLAALEARHRNVINALIGIKDQSSVTAEIKVMFNELEDVLIGVYLVRELSKRTLDFVLGFGERFSAFIISNAFKQRGVAASYTDARKIIITDENFGAARIDKAETYDRIKKHFQQNKTLQIVTGFVSSSRSGKPTTLGRGGSDYTASILAAALKANRIDIYTDVNGVLTADPRKVSKSQPIKHLSYEEAMELSHFGAKVIYPPTMQPALQADIPIIIKNTFNPDHPGTLINGQKSDTKSLIRGMSSIDEVALLTVRGSGMIGISGVASRIFSALAEAQVNIILITQASSEHAIGIAISPTQAETAKIAIEKTLKNEISEGSISGIQVEKQLSIIAVVGDKMRNIPGLAGKVFSALGRNGISVKAIAQGASERNISTVVEKKQEVKALKALHDAFFLSDVKTINIFLAGVGLIGKTMLELIDKQVENLYQKYQLQLNIVGLARSSKWLIDPNGIDLKEWSKRFDNEAQDAQIDSFIENMVEADLPNSIFVDCSSSQYIADQYIHILEKSISIATPNKKAASSDYSYYRKLQNEALRHNVSFNYETNVGAGLPMVATLKDQVTTGDTIYKIEGVFSGTLSYLFNTYDGKTPFSQLVRKAKELGYTEPDPRDDLNGMDMARKILILAREAGFKVNLEDIELESLVPDEAKDLDSIEAFFDVMKNYDDDFAKRFDKAKQANKKLCYIATFENNNATVKLEEIGPEHPFYSLQDMDNILALTTAHYNQTPLVVRGPGAGAYVTAGGVIADILRIANTRSIVNDAQES